MKNDYYSTELYGNKLKRCYEIASVRIKQYLEAEIQFVLKYLKSNYKVLELGCGYGRVLEKLAEKVNSVYGIDKSKETPTSLILEG